MLTLVNQVAKIDKTTTVREYYYVKDETVGIHVCCYPYQFDRDVLGELEIDSVII